MTDRIGTGYAYFQLAKALATGNRVKADEWKDIIAGMRSGDLQIGSRNPVSGMPIWATPAVQRGGFASGAFAAGGPLQPHEVKQATVLGFSTVNVGQCRAALNAWHLSSEGLAYLRGIATEGAFDAPLPEETALIAIAVLEEDQPEAAAEILTEISPYFDRLRFYPCASQPLPDDGVFLRTVADVQSAMIKKRGAAQIAVQDATLTIWLPLYDRLIDLVAKPNDIETAARQWLADYEVAKSKPMAKRWSDPERPFQRCRSYLESVLDDAADYDADYTHVTNIVDRYRAKYGTAQQRDAFRSNQLKQNVELKFEALSKALATRMTDLRPDCGVQDTAPLLAPIAPGEAGDGLPAETALPASFARKIDALKIAPVADHVAVGRIPSPEILADILPQVTADIHAQGFADPAQRHVYKSAYRAFRNRRSLLLLNYQHQARLGELPWIPPFDAVRTRSLNGTMLAKDSLRETACLSLTHFPHVQFPNPLVEELRALSKAADLDLPFTGEIAADIFMGGFSKTFTQAAKIGINRYAPTIYGAYYGVTLDMASQPLSKVCQHLAGVSPKGNWSVAKHGMIIEQQLILTTHNIAPLFAQLDLASLDLSKMAMHCFAWVCESQQVPKQNWRARLQSVKNAAYAWRQMLLFLAEMDAQTRSRTLTQIDAHFAKQTDPFRDLFHVAMTGLRNAAAGDRVTQNGGRVLLGWAQGQHPFLEAAPEPIQSR